MPTHTHTLVYEIHVRRRREFAACASNINFIFTVKTHVNDKLSHLVKQINIGFIYLFAQTNVRMTMITGVRLAA